MSQWLARLSIDFFIFLDKFKKWFKQDHSELKDVTVFDKVKGEKQKYMLEFDKSLYIAKTQQKKQEYNKLISSYNKQKYDDEGTMRDRW